MLQSKVISAELRLEEAVAKKTGVRKGIRSADSLQAAMNAVIAGEQAKGNVLFQMIDGQKVRSENPGLAEAMMALKIAPAQQAEIANALYQLEMSRGQNVNLDGKQQFFGGGRFNQPTGGQSLYLDLNDPAQGGDRLDIAKDVAFVNKARAANQAQGRSISPDAAKPFVGQLQSDIDAQAAERKAFKEREGYNMPRRDADNVQVWRGMNPAQVRVYQEGIDRKNRKGKAFADSKGMSQRYLQSSGRTSVVRLFLVLLSHRTSKRCMDSLDAERWCLGRSVLSRNC